MLNHRLTSVIEYCRDSKNQLFIALAYEAHLSQRSAARGAHSLACYEGRLGLALLGRCKMDGKFNVKLKAPSSAKLL